MARNTDTGAEVRGRPTSQPATASPHRLAASEARSTTSGVTMSLIASRDMGGSLRMFARGKKGRRAAGARTRPLAPTFFKIGESQLNMALPGREALRGQSPWRKVVEAGKGET